MFWNKPKRCKKGFVKKGDRCVRKEQPKVLSSCILDGKHYCKPGDKPLKPVIAYPGGKRKLADKIINKMPPHKVYVEPFLGGGCCFLEKTFS